MQKFGTSNLLGRTSFLARKAGWLFRRKQYPVIDASLNPLIEMLEASPLFDAAWYMVTNPDVASVGANPILHYLLYGASEGRDPSPLFATYWYANQNGIILSAMNPLIHYITIGCANGSDPNPLFMGGWYSASYEYNVAEYDSPLEHYLSAGAALGYDPCPLFSTKYYLDQNPDVTAAGINALSHYLSSGASEGRNPSPLFASKWYLDSNKDVATAGLNPLVHFLTYGLREGRNPTPSHALNRKALAKIEKIFGERSNYEAPAGDVWKENFQAGLSRRMSGLLGADVSPPLGQEQLTFSLITIVEHLEPELFDALAESIRKQSFGHFEWLIATAGRQDVEMLAACKEVADSDERFKIYIDENENSPDRILGLIHAARGYYFAIIDPNDLIYSDTLEQLAEVVRKNIGNLPYLITSDEQIVSRAGEPKELIWDWGISAASAVSAPIYNRFIVFSKLRALEKGAFSDSELKHLSVWDAVIRLSEEGNSTKHIPEVLYGRTASRADACLVRTHRQDFERPLVLQSFLKRRNLAQIFRLEPTHSEGKASHRLSRLHVQSPTVVLDFVVHWDAAELGSLEQNLRLMSAQPSLRRILYPSRLSAEIDALRNADAELAITVEWLPFDTHPEMMEAVNFACPEAYAKAVICSNVLLASDRSIWEALGLLELDVSAGVVGGILFTKGKLACAGLVAGVDDLIGIPFHGWSPDLVPQPFLSLGRVVTAFPAIALCIRADLLRAGCHLRALDKDDSLNGIEFCLMAGRYGYTSLFAAGFNADLENGLARYVGAGQPARSRLSCAYRTELEKAVFSRHLSRSSMRFGMLQSADEIYGENLTSASLPPAIPLNLSTRVSLSSEPAINLLLPSIRKGNLSGGPNTALNIAYRLASKGFAVRIITTDLSPEDDMRFFWDHVSKLAGGTKDLANLQVVDGSDRSKSVYIGVNDIFFATAWWTAVMAHAGRALVGHKPFIYLIQDYEPILYAASSRYALANETYSFPHIPLINTALIRDYLFDEAIGLFSDPLHRARTLTFEPAIDPAFFFPNFARDKKRKLLFYARPTVGVRNLYEVGVAALEIAVSKRILSADTWDIIGMGESFDPVDLGEGATLECATWLGFESYAQQMREADVLLSLMLSPHPSYPPLEMAGCGGLVVTNTYANKTAERLESISPNIIAVEPTAMAIAFALQEAVGRLEDIEGRIRDANTGLPASWDESFNGVLENLAGTLRRYAILDDAGSSLSLDEPRHLGLPSAEPGSDYETFLAASQQRRGLANVGLGETGLLTFVTTVWNTAPAYLDVLAKSLFKQVGGRCFEWFILDNGSHRSDTRVFLNELAVHAHVRLERVETNLGIIGGMRYCLDRARGRYILPLDSDDYLYPDCVQTIIWYIKKNNYPALLYTDEDKLAGDRLSSPFLKPDWDPVLFSSQCFIAHLCCFDRVLALRLGVYSDPRPEGSHDWDTFTRFFVEGFSPVHIPHILYSWRLHSQSTAGGNMESKPVVFDSQRAVLEKLLAGSSKGDLFDLVASPLFNQTPDWWLRRRRELGRPLTTILIRAATEHGRRTPDIQLAPGLDHLIVEMTVEDGLSVLMGLVQSAAMTGRLVHLMSSEAHPDDDEWAWEAIGHFDLYPDLAAVGGRIHSYGTVLEAGSFLGFGDGCGCPDRGRLMTDPGYAAQMWKPRSVNSVSPLHAVIDASFLLLAIKRAQPLGASIQYLGAWIGATAIELSRRIIYTPFISARTTIDWDALVSDKERSVYLSEFGGLMLDSQLWPGDFGLTMATAYKPTLSSPEFYPPSGALSLTYESWCSLKELKPDGKESQNVSGVEAGSVPFFSILTTLYLKTDARLFQLAADSVLTQSCDDFEWVLLAHGPIPEDLDEIVRLLEQNSKVRVARLDKNLGIVGGMRHALERAKGVYIVSLDSDDLLTTDALSAIKGFIDEDIEHRVFVYSDEDLISGDTRCHPFLRPAWDPVLDLENSWIWHLCAMDRSKALELGVYSDGQAEYCHDWDSVDRFAAAGYRPAHLNRITYHWRQHAASTSNNEGPNDVSAASVAHVLQRKINRLNAADRLRIMPYPIWRGAKEWWIEHAGLNHAPLVAISVQGSVMPEAFRTVDINSGRGVLSLHTAIAGVGDNSIVAVVGRGVTCSDQIVVREVVKLFECVPELAVISARLVVNEIVVSAGLSIDGHGTLQAPLDGRSLNYAGPFALALKAHSISAPAPELFFSRASFLRKALDIAPEGMPMNELNLWLGALAASRQLLVAYSPLITATLEVPRTFGFDSRSTNQAWKWYLGKVGHYAAANQGIAAYVTKKVIT